MGINASIKRNEVYIDNKLFFKIHRSDVWFGKEKCKLLDPLGNVLLYCRIKYPFYGAAKFDVIQNNINTIYTLVYTKKDLFWDVQGTKYHVKKKAFSFRRDFFRNEELIGTTDKKTFEFHIWMKLILVLQLITLKKLNYVYYYLLFILPFLITMSNKF